MLSFPVRNTNDSFQFLESCDISFSQSPSLRGGGGGASARVGASSVAASYRLPLGSGSNVEESGARGVSGSVGSAFHSGARYTSTTTAGITAGSRLASQYLSSASRLGAGGGGSFESQIPLPKPAWMAESTSAAAGYSSPARAATATAAASLSNSFLHSASHQLTNQARGAAAPSYQHNDVLRRSNASVHSSSRGPAGGTSAHFSGLQDTPKAPLGSGMGLGSMGSALAGGGGGGSRAVAFDTRSSVLGGPASTYDRRDGGGGASNSWDLGGGGRIQDREGGASIDRPLLIGPVLFLHR